MYSAATTREGWQEAILLGSVPGEQQRREGGGILGFQRVVEGPLPIGQHHRHADQRQVQHDDGGKQRHAPASDPRWTNRGASAPRRRAGRGRGHASRILLQPRRSRSSKAPSQAITRAWFTPKSEWPTRLREYSQSPVPSPAGADLRHHDVGVVHQPRPHHPLRLPPFRIVGERIGARLFGGDGADRGEGDLRRHREGVAVQVAPARRGGRRQQAGIGR